MSKVYTIKTVQYIPADLNTVWEFFSDPANLQKITPTQLGFDITSKYHGDHIYAGQIITYKIRPILNIPLSWMTEITHVAEKQNFVDEQRFGPYQLWHHQHHFRIEGTGVEMMDIVHYKLPLSFLGDIAYGLFVKKQLQEIFNFRFMAVEAEFGSVGRPGILQMG